MSDIEFSASSPFTFIQNILSTTKCYDIMQNSSKVIYIFIYLYCMYYNLCAVTYVLMTYIYIYSMFLLVMIIIIITIIMMYVFITLGYSFRDNNTIPISILCIS